MCLGVPGQVVSLSAAPGNPMAVVDVGGVRREVNVALLADEEVGIGTWVLVHVGFAMATMDEEEARRSLALVRELAAITGEDLTAMPEVPAAPSPP